MFQWEYSAPFLMLSVVFFFFFYYVSVAPPGRSPCKFSEDLINVLLFILQGKACYYPSLLSRRVECIKLLENNGVPSVVVSLLAASQPSAILSFYQFCRTVHFVMQIFPFSPIIYNCLHFAWCKRFFCFLWLIPLYWPCPFAMSNVGFSLLLFSLAISGCWYELKKTAEASAMYFSVYVYYGNNIGAFLSSTSLAF